MSLGCAFGFGISEDALLHWIAWDFFVEAACAHVLGGEGEGYLGIGGSVRNSGEMLMLVVVIVCCF